MPNSWKVQTRLRFTEDAMDHLQLQPGHIITNIHLKDHIDHLLHVNTAEVLAAKHAELIRDMLQRILTVLTKRLIIMRTVESTKTLVDVIKISQIVIPLLTPSSSMTVLFSDTRRDMHHTTQVTSRKSCATKTFMLQPIFARIMINVL